MVKNGNDFLLELNKTAYAWGLTDLGSYLNEKNRLTESSLQAEINARQKDLVEAQVAMKKIEKAKVYNSKGQEDTEKQDANRYAAWQKEEQAQKAYLDAVAKLKLKKEEMKDSDREAIYVVARGYKENQAALAEYQGDIVTAAKIRKQLDEEAHARKQLEANAMAGDIEAQKALTALRIPLEPESRLMYPFFSKASRWRIAETVPETPRWAHISLIVGG